VANSSAYYTHLIVTILDVAGEIGRTTRDTDISAAVATYLNFIQGKERAGQERAQVCAGLSVGRFDLPMYKALRPAAAKEVYFATFQSAGTSGQREFYQRAMSGPAIDTVLKMRQIVAEGGLSGDLKGLDDKTWFAAATVRVELLKTIEDHLANDLLDLAAVKQSKATVQLSTLAAPGVLALLSSLVVVGVITRSITRPLGVLARIMKRLAHGDVATTVEGVVRRDEVGEMAQTVAFFRSNMIETRELAAREMEATNQSIARAAGGRRTGRAI
jgi:HAMP domain-containing protein